MSGLSRSLLFPPARLEIRGISEDILLSKKVGQAGTLPCRSYGKRRFKDRQNRGDENGLLGKPSKY